jgi:integrase
VYSQHARDYIKPNIGAVRLRDLRPGHVADLLDKLQSGNGVGGHQLSASTITRVHAALRSSLTTALRMRLISFNPAQGVELPRVVRKRVKPWQAAELGIFLDAVQSDRLGALFETVAASGMRRGEVCGLRWSDLDPAAGVIVVRRQLTERSGDRSVCPYCGAVHRGLRFSTPKTEAGEYRRIELDQVTSGVLLHHQIQQGLEKAAWGSAYRDHQLVFAKEDGSPLSPGAVSELFNKLTDSVRMPDGSRLRRVRLHDSAWLLVAAGVEMNIF